jgi:ribonuclease HI
MLLAQRMIPKFLNNQMKNGVEQFIHTMYFDGCSKGNPGIAGAGATIYNNHKEIWAGYSFVGKKSTNNEAEYNGLILGLQKAIEMNIPKLYVNGDSQLIIYQMSGKYKCNSRKLLPLYETAKNLEKNFEHIEYGHVLRKLNHRADELSNIAIQKYFIKHHLDFKNRLDYK